MTSDPNFEKRKDLIHALHDSPTELVLALSGGGSLVLGDLLTVPGASRSVIEAVVPYSEESLRDYIGRTPDQYCCQRTARYLAMAAFHRGRNIIRERLNPRLKTSDGIFHQVPTDLSRGYGKAEAPTDSEIKTGTSKLPNDTTDLHDFFHLIGIGCTASLVTDREKKGEYRIHIAAQTQRRTLCFSLQLTKGTRNRQEEERLLADMILDVIETARQELFATEKSESGLSDFTESIEADDNITETKKSSTQASEIQGSEKIAMPTTGFDDGGWDTFGTGTTKDYRLRQSLPLDLKEGETIQGRQTVGSPALVDLFFGKIRAVLWKDGSIQHFRFRHKLPTVQSSLYNAQAEFMQAVFPGSFNPIHQGHLEMIALAERKLGSRVALEISVQNVDKPSLDYIELENRLTTIQETMPGLAVWLTQTPLFGDKSELFQGATFVVGADTLRRFAELRFYHESIHRLHDVLRVIGYHNCRFLVFARRGQNGKRESMRTLDVPDMLRSLADEIPPEEFTVDISSRDLRRNEF